MSKCVMILLLTSMLIAMVLSAAPPAPPQSPLPSPAKAYFLTLQWPAGVCAVESCKSRTEPLPSSFTLHGLWPCNTEWLQTVEDCTGPDFSGSALKDMRPDLLTYWPSLKEPENEFWKHEWEKHGRCSGLPLTQYFGDGLRLTQKHAPQIKSALVTEGIKPGRSSAATPIAIQTAIAKDFGFRPKLTCGSVTIKGIKYFFLKEIHLCMDQNFNFHDCSTEGWLENCGPYKDVRKTPVNFPDS